MKNSVLISYVKAMLATSTHQGNRLDEDFSFADVSAKTIETMKTDLEIFLQRVEEEVDCLDFFTTPKSKSRTIFGSLAMAEMASGTVVTRKQQQVSELSSPRLFPEQMAYVGGDGKIQIDDY